MRGRVVVAMSGGVDSSVAAAILHEQGFDVVGVAMRLVSHESGVTKGRQACCSYEDFEDARRVADVMGFPFYVIDLRADFARRVIGRFVDEYLDGRTPNPCMMCNRDIKFDRLWHRARALDADFVATGHYARIYGDSGGQFRLLRALDQAKDQSYFLFSLGQEELSRTLFPLGEMTKAGVRAKARALGLVNADKPESQEICFVPNNDYAELVERLAEPEQIVSGSIVDEDGALLGAHSGIHRFTVGQRRGLGIASASPRYVRRIDASTGTVIVAKREGLFARGLNAEQVSLVNPQRFETDQSKIEVKIRYRHPAIPATLTMIGRDRAEVRFETSYPAVTPGQACVFYDRDEVLGGGVIRSELEN